MISPRWRKIWRDLWHYKTRTVLVVLSIAVGVFAVGVIGGARSVLSRELNAAYAESNPSDAILLTWTPFDDAMLEAVRDMPEIAEADGRGGPFVRIQTGPDEWQLTQLVAVPDFYDMRLDRVQPESGDWPPKKREMLIERSALGLVKAGVGDVVTMRMADGTDYPVRIGGLAKDLYARIYVLDGIAYAYVTNETLEWLGEQPGYTELRIRVAGSNGDRQIIDAAGNRVRDRLEASGYPVLYTLVLTPGQHPMDYIVQAMMLIMGGIGILALGLSCFLVINTISALLAQQMRQIGMMKAVGARRGQLIVMYLVMVLLFGGLSLLIALPLGALGAFGLTGLMAGFFNIDITSLSFPPGVLAVQIAIALVVPMLAGIIPVLVGTRVTVREAISDYGIDESAFGRSRFDRGLAQLQRWWKSASRPSLLSLRNTFRRKRRLILTLLTLSLAGMVFITTFNLYSAFQRTINDMLNYYNYDVAFQFARPYRVERLVEAAEGAPGVVAAEGWIFYNTRVVQPDGSHSGNVMMFAPPAETKMVNATLREGRWLRPEDDKAIVVNSLLLRDLPGVGVGDRITLKLEGRESDWEIVGIAAGGQVAPMAFVNYPALARSIGEAGRADWFMLKTEQHDLATQQAAMKAVEEQLEARGFRIGATSIIAEEKEQMQVIFQGILSLLVAMTLLLALVGGLGLMGTMSINVLERTREVGVMRAIGASNRSLLRIFIQEGVLIGLLSWAAAALLSWPVSKLLTESVGRAFLNEPLAADFSWTGVLIWLAFVVILSILSSYWPARSAARLTVREVLAYE